MFYHIGLFILIILISYIVGITIVSLVDKKLSNISINLPKQDITVQLPEKYNPVQIAPSSEGIIEPYTNYLPSPMEDTCYEDHAHNVCRYGRTNYPDPHTMTPIDKRYFKYNYPNNMTMQDYVNWLTLYKTNSEELPYNHLRNLQKILAGETLTYKEGVIPPPSYINLPLNTAQYFTKLYNDELDITKPLESDFVYLAGSNINQYPESKRNKPEILYQKFNSKFCN